MIRLLLKKTDDFLFKSIEKIFKKIEGHHKFHGTSVDISQELKNFEENPLTCIIACSTPFETSIKIKLKMMIGIFFVTIPLVGFSLLAYLLNIEYSYSFMLTFVVAMLATSRLDEIARRYVASRLTTS